MRDPQPSEVYDSDGKFIETETDREYELIVCSMQRFAITDPEYIRIRDIRDWCNRHGALRDGFPPGTEAEEKAWKDLVAECRRRAQ